MAPLWGFLCLVVLGTIWLIDRADWGALREWFRALPPQTVRWMALLAALGLYAIWHNAALLITVVEQAALPVAANWLGMALFLLAVMYRFRQL